MDSIFEKNRNHYFFELIESAFSNITNQSLMSKYFGEL